MSDHCCYIIYSESINSFYIGETEDFNMRLYQHNSGAFNNAFTKRANDWKLFHVIPCDSRSQARKIEQHIKKMKSITYLLNLKKYPKINLRLKTKYQ
ncbi:MAG: GIY-YIG nuclease family protein [Cyclobacteriaceae bacterium]